MAHCDRGRARRTLQAPYTQRSPGAAVAPGADRSARQSRGDTLARHGAELHQDAAVLPQEDLLWY
jgi:hypothetical protein